MCISPVNTLMRVLELLLKVVMVVYTPALTTASITIGLAMTAIIATTTGGS